MEEGVRIVGEHVFFGCMSHMTVENAATRK